MVTGIIGLFNADNAHIYSIPSILFGREVILMLFESFKYNERAFVLANGYDSPFFRFSSISSLNLEGSLFSIETYDFNTSKLPHSLPKLKKST